MLDETIETVFIALDNLSDDQLSEDYPKIMLKEKKIKLSLIEEAEWEDYFIKEQEKALEIKAQITKTDKEIDAMVYRLYDLTDDEIAIIENH